MSAFRVALVTIPAKQAERLIRIMDGRVSEVEA